MTAMRLLRAAPEAACAPWPRHVFAQAEWAAFAAALATDPLLDLLAMWADSTHVHALFHDTDAADFRLASVAVEVGLYPALSPARPGAAWFERMIRDLWGHEAADGRDQRPWLDHGHWPITPPLASRPLPNLAAAEPAEFLPSEGEGLHQIAVGPVHAGIIEPGHFRFTANGETVVRLEIRLGYLHKGTLSLLRGKSPSPAPRKRPAPPRPRPVPRACVPSWASWNASPTISAISAPSSATPASPCCRPASAGIGRRCCAPPPPPSAIG
jgi:hypothetical protein